MAMKHLYILRHGKSSWASENITDAERTLTTHGTAAVARMGRECAGRGWQPALALVSTSVRTRQSFDAFAAALADAGGARPQVHSLPALYLAQPEAVVSEIRRHGGNASSILVIGHNPGLSELALWLARNGTAAMRARLARGLPTGGLVHTQLETESWSALANADARVTDVLTPKDLDQS